MSLFWTTVPRHFNTGPALPSCWWEENSGPGYWYYQLNMFLTGGTWASSRKLMLAWDCSKRSTMIGVIKSDLFPDWLLGQDSRRRGNCSGGTIINCFHSIIQHPDGERHPKKGPTSSPLQRSTIFISLWWGTQVNIHHHTKSVVTANRSMWRPVWCSSRCPAPGGKWWMCSTSNSLHPFWVLHQDTQKT